MFEVGQRVKIKDHVSVFGGITGEVVKVKDMTCNVVIDPYWFGMEKRSEPLAFLHEEIE